MRLHLIDGEEREQSHPQHQGLQPGIQFCHGKQHLASFLARLNILSLLFHTVLERLDEKYKLLRSHLSTRKTVFDHLWALTGYLYFENWDHLLTCMLEGLELEIPPNTR